MPRDPIKKAEYNRKWYEANKDRLKPGGAARARKWYEANKDRLRRIQAENKLVALAKCGPGGAIRCSWPGCNVDDPDMLTLDHVENDGAARRSKGEGRGYKVYERVVRENLTGLQTLCANHNLKKELMRRRVN